MLLRHPEVATLACDDCRDWVRDERWQIVTRRGEPQRNATRVGPCHRCPKKSPAAAPQYELSLKNIRAIELYYRARAMHFHNLDPRQSTDGILGNNMAIIDRIVRRREQDLAASSLLAQTPPLSTGKGA